MKDKMKDSDEYRRWLESSAEESRRMNAGATAIVPATGHGKCNANCLFFCTSSVPCSGPVQCPTSDKSKFGNDNK